LFDQSIHDAAFLLDRANEHTMLFNPFSLREVQLRGLLATGRPELATSLAAVEAASDSPAAPQREIIERITAADVLATAGESEHAASALMDATTRTEQRHLPHQLQRIIRVSSRSRSQTVQAVQGLAREALGRLRALWDQGGPATT
jgi:hypothetical protein